MGMLLHEVAWCLGACMRTVQHAFQYVLLGRWHIILCIGNAGFWAPPVCSWARVCSNFRVDVDLQHLWVCGHRCGCDGLPLCQAHLACVCLLWTHFSNALFLSLQTSTVCVGMRGCARTVCMGVRAEVMHMLPSSSLRAAIKAAHDKAQSG
jgi:hypothetical protein